MRFLTLIVKSARRNRRRTALTVAGTALTVFVASTLLSIEGGFRTLFASTDDAVLNVHEKGIACPLTGRVFDSYLRAVGATPHVTRATGVLRGLYSYQTKDNLVVVSGIDLDQFRKIKPVVIREGTEGGFAARSDAALVGSRAARDYGWHVGETVSFLEDGLTLRVAGIFECPDKAFETGLLVHKEFLEKVKRDEGKSTYLVVSVDHASAVSSVSSSIDGTLANYPKATTTQSERVARERELQDFAAIRRMLSALLLVTIVVGMLGAANSVSMSVRERTREVAVLRSLGLRRGHILQILVGESALACGAGGLVGLSAALAFLATAKSLGGMIPIVFGPSQVLAGLAVAFLVGVVGALLPGVNASRIRIVDGLRFVD